MYGGLAQMVECLLCMREVPGSVPGSIPGFSILSLLIAKELQIISEPLV